MQKLLSIFILLLLSHLCFSQNLDQFLGKWEMKTNKGATCESWEKSSDGTYLGTSYKINNQDTTILETVDLKYKDNVLVYEVSAKGNNDVVAFPLKNFTEKESTYIFENLAHDFPHRIIYQFIGDNQLKARVEGIVNGKLKSLDFNYTRTK